MNGKPIIIPDGNPDTSSHWIQATLDRFLTGCDLRRLFEAVVDTEAWDAVRISAERYSAECGVEARWNGNGYMGQKTLILRNLPGYTDWLDLRMDAFRSGELVHFGTGYMLMHAETDFGGYRKDYDWDLNTSDRRNRKVLETHRRFFEILAGELGMSFAGFGPDAKIWFSEERPAAMCGGEVSA